MTAKQLLESKKEELTENGNLAVVGEIVDIEIRNYDSNSKIDVLIYLEELGDTIKLGVTQTTKNEKGEWVETEESIARADELCMAAFGETYDGLADNADNVVEAKVFLSSTGNLLLSDLGSGFKTYDKPKREIIKAQKGILKELQLDEDGNWSIVFETTKGELFQKKFYMGLWSNRKRQYMSNLASRQKAAHNLLPLFGTTKPEFVEGAEVSYTTKELHNNKGNFYVVINDITGYEEAVSKYDEFLDTLEGSAKVEDSVRYAKEVLGEDVE